MLRNDFYYRLKPFLPRGARMGIRRWFAVRKRERIRHVWPIMPGSERPPKGWLGWPEARKFSLVLTHDVESQKGVDRVKNLAKLEMELGFRSSFNFIPEGDYSVPSDLRFWLTDNGFEVGVHDLKHDGHLFDSRKKFRERATRINKYLEDWNVVGFRSGFMLNELSWLHELSIEYDASTFDTDPFEPQPKGRHTIFPFWVPAPESCWDGSNLSGTRLPSPVLGPVTRRHGYVELPYTLPQDSTLFLILREETADIWLRKLDWIAGHGGMALINVHPDYLRFDDEPHLNRTYPIAHYRKFLEHIRDHYNGGFWQALPKQMARFVAQCDSLPITRLPKRVGMVTHSFYESDNRVMRYAEALAGRGDQVDVFALCSSPELPKQETLQGVNLFRIQDRFGKTERSKLAYLWPLIRFLGVSSRWLARCHAREPYDFLHIHNVPDFMVFSAWYPKLTGARIVLDIHDIVPEFFASKFGKPPSGVMFTLLKWMERASAGFADHVIIANHLWLDKYAARTRTEGRCTTFINNVDSGIFTSHTRTRLDDKLIILFPGGLQWHQGVDIAIRAFKQVSIELPNAEFHIYGDGNARESLVKLAAELGLNGHVRFFQPVSVRQIARIMAEADLGVVPKRADSFGNEAYSTKIMEFMSVGVPVVISSTKVDRHYFDDSVVRFFESGNADALALEMLDVLRNADRRHQMVDLATRYAIQNSWESRKADYLNLVDSVCH